jgi:hypothetical protein
MNPLVFEHHTYSLDTLHHPIQVHVCGSRLNDPTFLLPGAWQDHTVFPKLETLSASRYVVIPELQGVPERLLGSLVDELHAVLVFVLGENEEPGLLSRSWRIIARGEPSRSNTLHWRRSTFYGASRLSRRILAAYLRTYGLPPRSTVVLAHEEEDLIQDIPGMTSMLARRLPAIRQDSGWHEAYHALADYMASFHQRNTLAYEQALGRAMRLSPRLSVALVDLLQEPNEDLPGLASRPRICANDWQALLSF